MASVSTKTWVAPWRISRLQTVFKWIAARQIIGSRLSKLPFLRSFYHFPFLASSTPFACSHVKTYGIACYFQPLILTFFPGVFLAHFLTENRYPLFLEMLGAPPRGTKKLKITGLALRGENARRLPWTVTYRRAMVPRFNLKMETIKWLFQLET